MCVRVVVFSGGVRKYQNFECVLATKMWRAEARPISHMFRWVEHMQMTTAFRLQRAQCGLGGFRSRRPTGAWFYRGALSVRTMEAAPGTVLSIKNRVEVAMGAVVRVNIMETAPEAVLSVKTRWKWPRGPF